MEGGLSGRVASRDAPCGRCRGGEQAGVLTEVQRKSIREAREGGGLDGASFQDGSEWDVRGIQVTTEAKTEEVVSSTKLLLARKVITDSFNAGQ